MHGLVTLLPPPFYQQVEAIWDRLEQNCGLKGIRVTPYPHFTWNIAEHYDFDRLKEVATTIALSSKPFAVRTAGLGLFTGANPVVHIPLVRTIELSLFHEQCWRAVQDISTELGMIYAKVSWAPHISLALGDVDDTSLPQVMDELAAETYSWEFAVDNIALIRDSGRPIGELEWKIPLGR